MRRSPRIDVKLQMKLRKDGHLCTAMHKQQGNEMNGPECHAWPSRACRWQGVPGAHLTQPSMSLIFSMIDVTTLNGSIIFVPSSRRSKNQETTVCSRNSRVVQVEVAGLLTLACHQSHATPISP